MVARENIANRSAVGDHISLEAPLPSKLILQQEFIGARRLTVDRVVCAHHRSGFALDDCGAETRLIRVELIVLAHVHVREVARGLRTAVHNKAFGRRNYAVVLRVVALHAGDKGDTHTAYKEWVLPIGLLSA